MRRRTYLGAAAAVVAGLAGCSDSSEPTGPAATVEAFFEAAADGDAAAANEYVHEDAPVPELTEGEATEMSESDLRVESTEVLEETDDTARVRAEFSMLPPGADDRVDEEQVYELRRSGDDEWRLYDVESTGDTGPAAPQVVWDASEETDDDGAVVAVAFTHGGGDTVDVANLEVAVVGDRASPAEAGESLMAGSTLTVPLDAGGEGVDAGTDVDLEWVDPETGQGSVVGMHTLTAGTAGALGPEFAVDA